MGIQCRITENPDARSAIPDERDSGPLARFHESTCKVACWNTGDAISARFRNAPFADDFHSEWNPGVQLQFGASHRAGGEPAGAWVRPRIAHGV